MNSNDPRLRLITLALDGELSPTDRKRLRRLLRSDPESMETFRKFREDKRKLAFLSVPVLPVDFSRSVANALSGMNQKHIAQQSCVSPFVRRDEVRLMRWPSVLALSGAWLIGLVFLAGWLVGSGPHQGQSNPVVADKSSAQEPEWRGTPALGETVQVTGSLPIETGAGSSEESWFDWLAPDAVPARHLAGNAFQPSAERSEFNLKGQGGGGEIPTQDLLGAPARTSRELEELSLKLPRIVPWNDLGDLPSAFQALKDKSGTIQLDLPAMEPGHAVDVLMGVLKSQKKGVVVDSLAMDRLRRGNIRAHYMVVLEEVDAGQLETILRSLKNADGKLPVSKSGQFTPSLIVSAPDSVRKQLKSMTGWDFGTDSTSKIVRAAVSKDLGEETTQQALKAIESGGGSRYSGMVPPSLPTALVVAYSPYYPAVKTQPQSVEVRRFVEVRQASTKSGPGRAIFVFRNGNN